VSPRLLAIHLDIDVAIRVNVDHSLIDFGVPSVVNGVEAKEFVFDENRDRDIGVTG
jgi:hypothetical protein